MLSASELFGIGYDNKNLKLVGSFDVKNSITNIIINYGPFKHILLPPGGYAIYYKSGSYSVNGPLKYDVVGGSRGLHVEWQLENSNDWCSIPFPLINPNKINDNGTGHIFTIEMIKKGRIRLKPPEAKKAVGSVELSVYFCGSTLVDNIKEHL